VERIIDIKMLGGFHMKVMLKLSVVLAMVLTFSSCSTGVVSHNYKETTANSEQLVQPSQVQTSVKTPSSKEMVATLCSDEFQGRLTGSKGNEKAEEYIEKTFKDIGLTPLFEDSYYEPYTQEVYKKSGLIDINDKPENKVVNNIVGVIKGKDSKKAVVISAHFDHLGFVNGTINRGALDNASGVSALIEIANTLKEKSKEKLFDMDIILCAFNGEETGLNGSRAFVEDIISKPVYGNLYNINIDCIGATDGGKLALKNKSKVSNKLYDAIKTTMKKYNIEFSDTAVIGLGDHLSFESASIPNVFLVQENVKKLVHTPKDTPDILDYGQMKKIANAICDFIETNEGVDFKLSK
jgi:Zn-dependent M28 family amino/carboxypeptidase